MWFVLNILVLVCAEISLQQPNQRKGSARIKKTMLLQATAKENINSTKTIGALFNKGVSRLLMPSTRGLPTLTKDVNKGNKLLFRKSPNKKVTKSRESEHNVNITSSANPELTKPNDGVPSKEQNDKLKQNKGASSPVIPIAAMVGAFPLVMKNKTEEENISKETASKQANKNFQYIIGAYIFAGCCAIGIIWLIISHIKTKQIMRRYNKQFCTHFSAVEAYATLIQNNQLSYQFRGDGTILLKKTTEQSNTNFFKNHNGRDN